MQTVYSLSWASKVVESFQTTFPAGALLAERCYSISKTKAAWILAHDRKKWERYKSLCKYLEGVRVGPGVDKLSLPKEILQEGWARYSRRMEIP